jgi:carboxypeptidase T
MRRPSSAALLLAGLLILWGVVAPATAAAPNFPSYDSRYHNYPEMVAEIKAAETAYPSLVHVFSMGNSYQGRDIWAAKVSDNVNVDEPEPEVFIDALHHAREHLVTEQALYLLRVLSRGYTTDSHVRDLVNSREVWIVFAVNPDGFEYDLTGNPYRAWRKNRQPNTGSSYVGTDLNRNYDYHWSCCGGSSGSPSSITYRGRTPFSAPETRVIRDFVKSRVIDGRQQIRVHLALHTNDELVLWPYGYTRTDIPIDMTTEDHTALVALGRAMASRNGYKAEQSSDLYISDGDETDWMYGRYRIFSYVWELYPKDQSTVWKDHYPPDEVIARETARNRSALLHAISAASCPYSGGGDAMIRRDCGALYDDFEINRGWQRDPDGTDTASAGVWQIGDPVGVSSLGPKQLGTTVSGRAALVTGITGATSTTANDLDGGVTTMRSAPVTLGPTVGPLTFSYYLAHGSNSSSADWLRFYVEADGVRTLVKEELGSATDDDAAWASVAIPMASWAGKSVRIVIAANDGAGDSYVEAAVDDLRIRRP